VIERDLFLAAIDVTDEAERKALLAARCGSDSVLLRRLELMLQCHDQQRDFLESPPFTPAAPRSDSATASEIPTTPTAPQVGDQLGDYHLVERLGEGGFAEVFAARQDTPIERSVAIKLVKSSVGAHFGVERMEQERRLMAKLNHPGIATMFDWGTTPAGQPYLVMEWVNGDALTRYCAREALSLNEKLRLMVSVCQAVYHAHLRGVLHLDLKPSNILAQRADGIHQVKVIDFGIGRLISESQSLANTLTALMGTPTYMSPERLQGDCRAIGPQSDIYSLGIVLRDLVAGPVPSSHATGESGEQFDQPTRMPRELQWIIDRATASLPGDRYESARDLANDLERYLTRYPVLSRPSSRWYVCERFLARNRLLAGLSAVFLVGMLLSAIVILQAWTRAERAAKAERETAASLRRRQAQLVAATNSARKAEQLAARRHYAALVSEAAQALMDGEVHRAASLLASCPESPRGWEWRHLARRVPISVTRKLTQLAGPIRVVEFATSDRYVVYSSGGELCLLDASHQIVAKWSTPPRQPHATPVAVNPAEASVAIARASAAGEDIVELYDVGDGGLIRALPLPESHAGTIHSLCFRPDGKQLLLNVTAAGQRNSSMLMVDLTDGRSTNLGSHSSAVSSLAFHNDGRRFAIADVEGCVWIWSVGEESPRRLQRDRGYVRDRLSFSRDGRWLAAGSARGYGILWNLETETSTLMRGHVGQVVDVRFVEDAHCAMTAGVDGTVRRWSLPDGRLQATYRGQDSSISGFARRPDGHEWICGSLDGSLFAMDCAGPQVSLEDGHRVADNGSVEFRSQAAPSKTSPATAAPSLRKLSVSFAGYVLVGTEQGALEWRRADGSVLRRAHAHTGRVNVLEVINDLTSNPRCITGGSDGVIIVWDIETGQALIRTSIVGAVQEMLFDGPSDTVFVRDDRAKVWALRGTCRHPSRGQLL
jgi:WD40 repeat protein